MLATEQAIESLLITGQQEWKTVFSPHGRGLYIRLMPAGRKVWYYRYTHKGKHNDIDFAEFPEVDLAGAQSMHAELLRKKREGQDIASIAREEKRQRQQEEKAALYQNITNQQLFDNWIVTYAKRPSLKTRRVPSARTVEAARYRWDRYVSQNFKFMYACETTKTDINKVISKAVTQSREEARKLCSTITMMYDHGEDIGVIQDAPTVNLKPGRLGASSSIPRERHMSLKETETVLNFWLRHTNILGFDRSYPPTNTSEIVTLALLFLLTTGQRRSEVMNAKWGEFNFQERIWTIPPERHKPRRGHQIYLTDMSLEIITRANAICGQQQNYVFDTGRHTNDENRRGDTLNRVLTRMLKSQELKGKVTPFSPHDIRRTFATLAGDYAGGSEEVIRRMLGQVSGDKLVVTYQRAKKWQDQVEVWTNIETVLKGLIK